MYIHILEGTHGGGGGRERVGRGGAEFGDRRRRSKHRSTYICMHTHMCSSSNTMNYYIVHSTHGQRRAYQCPFEVPNKSKSVNTWRRLMWSGELLCHAARMFWSHDYL